METISDESSSPIEAEPFPDADSPEKLIAFAQRHYASAHPNQRRIGCPGDDFLKATIFSGKLPDRELLQHTFECSECYRQMQLELAAYRATRPAHRASLWERLTGFWELRPLTSLACGMAFLLLILGGGYVVRRLHNKDEPGQGQLGNLRVETPPASPIVQATASPSPSAQPTDPPLEEGSDAPPVRSGNDTRRPRAPKPRAPVRAAPPQESPSREGEVARALEKPTPLRKPHSVPPAQRQFVDDNLSTLWAMKARTIQVDLEDYARTRDAGGEIIKLPRGLVRLFLRLPEGSLKGSYVVSVLDAFGRLLKTAKSRSVDGRRLVTVVNLTAITPGKYILGLTHESGSVIEYAFELTDAKPKTFLPEP